MSNEPKLATERVLLSEKRIAHLRGYLAHPNVQRVIGGLQTTDGALEDALDTIDALKAALAQIEELVDSVEPGEPMWFHNFKRQVKQFTGDTEGDER